ncbi:MAG: hypothetical protein P4L84_28825 [Isosphaeraceae bacterium]|nr:hypothetical protein [Isosphaeraceae bacterium]
MMKDRDHFNSIHQDAVIHIVREPLNADAPDVSIDWSVEFRRLSDSIQSALHLLNELFAPAGMELEPGCSLLELTVSDRTEDDRQGHC